MIRFFPTTLIAAYLGFATFATWVLCQSDALNNAAPVFFH